MSVTSRAHERDRGVWEMEDECIMEDSVQVYLTCPEFIPY